MSKNDKRTLYVGGLQEDVVCDHLRAAFIPFGEVSAPPSLLRSRERNGPRPPPPPSSRGLGAGQRVVHSTLRRCVLRGRGGLHRDQAAPPIRGRSPSLTHTVIKPRRGALRGEKGGGLPPWR